MEIKMKCTEIYKVDLHHCDASGCLRVSQLLRFMQECSTKDLCGSPVSQRALVEDGKSYVLCRLNMSVYKSAKAYDEIEISTWPCESRGVALTRCYQARIDGNIIAEATTVWGIIDIEKRRFCRLGDFDKYLNVTEEPLELDSPSRIHIPPEMQLRLVGEKTVLYSDTDVNGHMNNTNYPDIYCDFIPHMSKKRVIMMGINYSSEAKEGDVLKVYMNESDGQYYFRTVKSDGTTNSEAIIMPEYVY